MRDYTEEELFGGYKFFPSWKDKERMRCVISNMKLKCGTICPRCGAELHHFTNRGFPICSNSDCQYLAGTREAIEKR